MKHKNKGNTGSQYNSQNRIRPRRLPNLKPILAINVQISSHKRNSTVTTSMPDQFIPDEAVKTEPSGKTNTPTTMSAREGPGRTTHGARLASWSSFTRLRDPPTCSMSGRSARLLQEFSVLSLMFFFCRDWATFDPPSNQDRRIRSASATQHVVRERDKPNPLSLRSSATVALGLPVCS